MISPRTGARGAANCLGAALNWLSTNARLAAFFKPHFTREDDDGRQFKNDQKIPSQEKLNEELLLDSTHFKLLALV